MVGHLEEATAGLHGHGTSKIRVNDDECALLESGDTVSVVVTPLRVFGTLERRFGRDTVACVVDLVAGRYLGLVSLNVGADVDHRSCRRSARTQRRRPYDREGEDDDEAEHALVQVGVANHFHRPLQGLDATGISDEMSCVAKTNC